MAIAIPFPSLPFSAPESAIKNALGAIGSHAQFRFELPDLKESFGVLRFRGRDALSHNYSYRIHVESADPLDGSKYAGAAGRLTVENGGPRAGVVENLEYLGPTNSGHEYVFLLESPLAPLSHTLDSRVWVDQSLVQVMEAVLKPHGVTGEKLKQNLKGEYRPFEQVVQYNESDFDFLCRLAAQAGLWFRFETTDKGAQLVLEDDSSTAPPSALKSLACRPATGAVRGELTAWEIKERSRRVSEAVKLKDYNPDHPDQTLLCAAGTATTGVTYQYAPHFLLQDEGEQQAKQLLQAINVDAKGLVITCDAPGLLPGTVLELMSHPNEALNGGYLILSVDEQGDQTSAQPFGARAESQGPGLTFMATVTLLPAATPFRPRRPLAPPPAAATLQTGVVESTGGDYAFLDEQGRYRMRAHFDVSDNPKAQASAATRLATPYAGPQYGFHFPLHADTEVLWAGINGDLNRSVIVNAVANPATASPVTSKNNTQNILRTFGGNELKMEDLKGEEHIALFTKDEQNILKLDANTQGHQISLKTEKGKQEHACAKTYTIESGDSYILTSGNNKEVTVENRYQLQTKNQEIALSAGTDIQHAAAQNIRWQAEQLNIEQRSEQDCITEAGNNYACHVLEGDHQSVIEMGNAHIEAAKAVTILGQGNADVTVQNGPAITQWTAGGDVSVRGNTVNIEAGTINIKGQKLGNN